jgi:hypothetical protein
MKEKSGDFLVKTGFWSSEMMFLWSPIISTLNDFDFR